MTSAVRDSTFSEELFVLDDHNGLFKGLNMFHFDDGDLTALREECIHLICNAAEQYQLVDTEQSAVTKIQQKKVNSNTTQRRKNPSATLLSVPART